MGTQNTEEFPQSFLSSLHAPTNITIYLPAESDLQPWPIGFIQQTWSWNYEFANGVLARDIKSIT